VISPTIVKTPVKPLLAFVLMGTAVLFFSLVDATAKWLTQGYDPWQIVFLSRIVPITVALIVAYRATGNPFNFYTKFPKVQITGRIRHSSTSARATRSRVGGANVRASSDSPATRRSFTGGDPSQLVPADASFAKFHTHPLQTGQSRLPGLSKLYCELRIILGCLYGI